MSLGLILAFGCTPGGGSQEPGADTPGEGAPAAERDDEFVLVYGDRSIYVYADPDLEPEVERLFLLFEDLRAEAVEISSRTQLPIGWTTLSFVVEGSRGERLIVTEPNYDADPESAARPDISVSLATLARQRGVLERVGVPGAAINFDQHVLTTRGILERSEVMLIRVESPGGRLTGWRIAPAEGIAESDEVDSIPVHAVLAARPELLDAMLLPPGFLVLYSGAQLTTIVNERNEVVWDWTVDGEMPRGGGPDLAPMSGSEPDRAQAQPLLEPLD